MRRHHVLMVAAVLVASVGPVAAVAAQESSPPTGIAAPMVVERRTVSDPVADTDFAVADVRSASLQASADGTMLASITVDEWSSPSSESWRNGDTSIMWSLDGNGDGVEDGVARMDAAEGTLRAGVLGPRGRVICLGEPTATSSTKTYSMTFSAACLGNPETVRFRARFVYDEITFDLTDSDLAPNSGWSGSLVNPAYVGPLVTVDPARTYDSRNGPGQRPAGSITEITVAGRDGVPVDAAAVLLNVTAVQPAENGFATVFPCGFDRPEASNLNYRARVNIANAVLARVGVGGKVCVYTVAAMGLVIDVNGFVPKLSEVGSVTPARLLDTRDLGAAPTRGSVTEVAVLDRFGVPDDAVGVVLNVTAVRPSEGGFMTVFPCGSEVPTASNLNFVAGQNVPNAVVARVGERGSVCVFTSVTSHLVIDVNGYLPAATKVVPLPPERLLDTRETGRQRPSGSVTTIVVAGKSDVPATASGAILNVTAVRPANGGFFTVYPCGGDVPTTSNVNFSAGANVPNAVVVRVGIGGAVCVFTSATSHVLVDLNGYVP